MSNRDLAENIYIALKDKGAEIGNASISIIERVLDKDATIAAQAARIEALTQALGGLENTCRHAGDLRRDQLVEIANEIHALLAATIPPERASGASGAVPIVGAGTRAEV